MCDHEIDLVDAEQHDNRTAKNAEIRGEIAHVAEYQVLSDPQDAWDKQDSIG